MRVVRGLMLKGAGFTDVSTELAAMVGLLLVVSAVAISRYRVTLDSGPLDRALPARLMIERIHMRG